MRTPRKIKLSPRRNLRLAHRFGQPSTLYMCICDPDVTLQNFVKMISIKVCSALLTLFGFVSSQTYQKKIPYTLAGTYMTGPKAFIGGEPVSPDVPFCRSEEPCGYYTFDPSSKRPLKWIPSWCQCQTNQDCVYARHNLRLKTYEHSCVSRSENENDVLFD